MARVLFIDNRVQQHEQIAAAAAEGVTAIVYDWATETLAGLLAKVPAGPIESVGLVQHGSDFMVEYALVGEEGSKARVDDEELTSWAPLMQFFGALKAEHGVAVVDFISCSLYSAPRFATVMATLETALGMNLRASRDRTGNLVAGGNWVQESDGVDIKGLYFTDAIEEYKGVLYWASYFATYSFVSVKADGSNRNYAMVSATQKAIYPNFTTFTNTIRGPALIWGGTEAQQTLPVAEYIGVATNQDGFALLKAGGVIDGVSGSGYTKIASTQKAFAALNANGTIYAWGEMQYGGYGAPSGGGYIEIASTDSAFAALHGNGTIYVWGNQFAGGSGGPEGDGFIAITSDKDSFVALHSNGSLHSWRSAFGFEHSKTIAGNYVAVVGGVEGEGYAALKADGSVTSFGALLTTSEHQPPTGNDFTTVVPYNKGYIAMRTNGSLSYWGDWYYYWSNTPNIPTGSGFSAIAVNHQHVFGIKATGEVVTGTYGTVGTEYYTSITVDCVSAFLLRNDGAVIKATPGISDTYATQHKGIFPINMYNTGLITVGGVVTIIGNNAQNPPGHNFAFIAGTTDKFFALKDERCAIASISVDGVNILPGETVAVYNSNPTINVTTLEISDTLVVSSAENLPNGPNTVTISITNGPISKTYSITLNHATQVPEPSVQLEVRKVGPNVHITPTVTFSGITSSALQALDLGLLVRSSETSPLILLQLQPTTSNPLIYRGTGIIPLTQLPWFPYNLAIHITSPNLQPRILSVSFDTEIPTYAIAEGSGLNTILITPNIPIHRRTYYNQYIKLISPSIQFPEYIYSSVSGFSYDMQKGMWVVPYQTAWAVDYPFTVSGIPFNGETTIEIVGKREDPDLQGAVTYIFPISVTLPDISTYTPVQMAALPSADVKQILLSPDTLACLSAGQFAAISSTVFDAANADITGAQRTSMLTYIETSIRSLITAELNGTSSNAKATIDTVLDYYMRIIGDTQLPLIIENANLSRLITGAPTSANAIFCVARTGVLSTVTIQVSTLLEKDPYVYIVGGDNTQITLKRSTANTGELVVNYDSNGLLSVNAVQKTTGDTIATTAIGPLEIIHPNLLKTNIPQLATPVIMKTTAGPPLSGLYRVRWQVDPDVDYIMEESHTEEITWDSASPLNLSAPGLYIADAAYENGYFYKAVLPSSEYSMFRLKAVSRLANALAKPSEYRTIYLSPPPPAFSAVYLNGSIHISLTPPSEDTIYLGTLNGYKIELFSNYSGAGTGFYVYFTYNGVTLEHQNSNVIQHSNIPSIFSVTPSYTNWSIYEQPHTLLITARVAVHRYTSMFGVPRSITFNPSQNQIENISDSSLIEYSTGSTPLLSLLSLEQLASLPLLSIENAAAGASGPSVRAAIASRVAATVASALAASSGALGIKASIDMAMKAAATAAAASGDSIPAFTVPGANMSLMNASAPVSVNTVLLSAAPLTAQGPHTCNLTDAQLTTLAADGHIYIGGDMGDAVVLKSQTDPTKSVTISFEDDGVIRVDGVVHAMGDSVVTALGRLVLLFAGSLQAMLGSTMLPVPLHDIYNGSFPNGDLSFSWLAVAEAGSYGVQSSSDGGASWSTEVTTTGTSYRFGGLTVGSAYKFRVRSIPASGSTLTPSYYMETASRISYAEPGAPTVSLTIGATTGELVITAPTNTGGGTITGYEIAMGYDVVGAPSEWLQIDCADAAFTVDESSTSGTFTSAGTYTLTNIPVRGRSYYIRVRTLCSHGQSGYTYVAFNGIPLSNVSNLASVLPTVAPAQLAAVTATEIATIVSNAPALASMSLQQLGAFSTTAIESAVASSSSVASGLVSAVSTAVSSALVAAVSTNGGAKTDVDAALKRAAAAQAAVSSTATITATTVDNANLKHIATAGLEATTAIVASALPPKTGGAPVDCVLTPAQESVITAGGQLYIAGGTGDKLRFVSQDGARSALFEFPGSNQVNVNGVSQTIGSNALTAFGTIRLLFSGSGGFEGIPPPTQQALSVPAFDIPLVENGYIYMSWASVNNAGSYGLQLSDDNGATWGTEVTTTVAHKMFNTLTVGTVYKFRVRALPAANDSVYMASAYSEPYERMCYGVPDAPGVIAALASNGVDVNITITPPTALGGSTIEKHRVLVLDNDAIPLSYSFSSSSPNFTYEPAITVGDFDYTSNFTGVRTYTITGIPLDGRTYTINVGSLTAIGFGSDPGGSATITMPSVSSLTLQQFTSLTSQQITSLPASSVSSLTVEQVTTIASGSSPIIESMPLSQLAALSQSASAVTSQTSEPAKQAVAATISSAVSAAVTENLTVGAASSPPGSLKTAVDSALRNAAAAQAAVSSSSAITATTVENANLKHIAAAAAASATAIVAAALPPRSGGVPVDCVLTPAQEATIATTGHVYTAGTSGEKIRYISQDGLRYVLFEFPAAGQVKIDGISRAIGDEIVTAMGTIRLVAIGSSVTAPATPTPTPICFLADAPVLTPAGYRPISAIKAGDMVRTAAGRDVAVKRAFAKEYAAGPGVNPFVIPKGAFGALRALPISPNHEVMVRGKGMVKAKDLGLKRMKMTDSFTYYNLELEDWVRDNLVVAGVECESLAPAERITMTKAEFGRFVRARYGPAAAARLRTVCFEEADGAVSMPKLK